MKNLLSFCCLSLSISFLVNSADAAVSVSFLDQAAEYDGKASANVGLFDPASSVNFIMTVSSTGTGGNLNSNVTGLGIGDANLNDGEIIQITFNRDIQIQILDFGGIGADLSDGATVKIGSNPSFDLFTGQSNFDGTQDVWQPTSPVSLATGEIMEFRGSSATSIFDVDGMTISAVPEPSSSLLLACGGIALLSRRKRLLS